MTPKTKKLLILNIHYYSGHICTRYWNLTLKDFSTMSIIASGVSSKDGSCSIINGDMKLCFI
jgi:hypothetical protein